MVLNGDEIKNGRAYDEVRDETRRIEHDLSEFLGAEDLARLGDWCFEYSENKASWLEIPRGDVRRAYLNAFVRYELMSEVRECVEGFYDGITDESSLLSLDVLEHNKVESILHGIERRVFG